MKCPHCNGAGTVADTLAGRLGALRHMHGLTYRDIAQRTDNALSHAYAHHLETGKTTNPNSVVLVALAGLYGVTTDFLLGLEKDAA